MAPVSTMLESTQALERHAPIQMALFPELAPLEESVLRQPAEADRELQPQPCQFDPYQLPLFEA